MRQEERDRLIVEHLWVPRHAVAKLSHLKTIPREELLGLANEALVEAANRFDPSRGVKFSTFACLCCYRKVSGSLRTAERRAKRLGGVQPVIPPNVPGRQNSGVKTVENTEFCEALKSRAVLSVQGRDRRIVEECIIGGKTYSALARELGVTPQAVSCAARKIKEKLKVELKGMKELYYE